MILDDGDDLVRDLIPERPDVVYQSSWPASAIGAKRNIACGLASGDVFVHWDDDDWSNPSRIAEQVEALEDGVELAGYSAMLFADDGLKAAWLYESTDDYALGTSFCYRRELWERHPFPNVRSGEDAAMLGGVRAAIQPGVGMMVARLHSGNTSSHPVGAYWSRVGYEALPAGYRAL